MKCHVERIRYLNNPATGRNTNVLLYRSGKHKKVETIMKSYKLFAYAVLLGSLTIAAQLGNDKIVAGLKEALQVGVGNAVSLTGKTDGFFKNEAIKILMPEKVRSLE